MTSISTSIYSGQYSQLPSQSSVVADLKAASSKSSTAQVTKSATTLDAYLLDLSPQAQEYLKSLGDNTATKTNAASILRTQSSFSLNKQQQEQVFDILVKYKDAPLTKENFAKINAELDAVGLSPDKLALKYKTQTFDATTSLINALNGDFSNTVPTNSDIEARKENYTEELATQWQKLSSFADESTDLIINNLTADLTAVNKNTYGLTSDQQQEVLDILMQYKDAPMTKENFAKIDKDLSDVGLSPDQLARKHQTQTFNATQSLMNALNGDFSNTVPTNSEVQSRKGSYINELVAKWQKVSASEGA